LCSEFATSSAEWSLELKVDPRRAVSDLEDDARLRAKHSSAPSRRLDACAPRRTGVPGAYASLSTACWRNERREAPRRLKRPVETRAVLVGSQVVGLALARHVVHVEPLASLPPADVVDLIAPTLQHYLVGELRQPGDPPTAPPVLTLPAGGS
jgi:hypothetical protein